MFASGIFQFNEATDVYALGLTLGQLFGLTVLRNTLEQFPFLKEDQYDPYLFRKGDTHEQVVALDEKNKLLHDEHSLLPESIREQVIDCLYRMTAVNPKDRPTLLEVSQFFKKIEIKFHKDKSQSVRPHLASIPYSPKKRLSQEETTNKSKNTTHHRKKSAHHEQLPFVENHTPTITITKSPQETKSTQETAKSRSTNVRKTHCNKRNSTSVYDRHIGVSDAHMPHITGSHQELKKHKIKKELRERSVSIDIETLRETFNIDDPRSRMNTPFQFFKKNGYSPVFLGSPVVTVGVNRVNDEIFTTVPTEAFTEKTEPQQDHNLGNYRNNT